MNHFSHLPKKQKALPIYVHFEFKVYPYCRFEQCAKILHLTISNDHKYIYDLRFFLFFNSSAYDMSTGLKIAVKKLSRPFQSIIHAKRTYRELRLLKHMKHENVSQRFSSPCSVL